MLNELYLTPNTNVVFRLSSNDFFAFEVTPIITKNRAKSFISSNKEFNSQKSKENVWIWSNFKYNLSIQAYLRKSSLLDNLKIKY